MISGAGDKKCQTFKQFRIPSEPGTLLKIKEITNMSRSIN